MAIIKLTDVRLSFAEGIYKAKRVNGEGEPKFSASFLMTKNHPAVKIISDAIREVAKEKWKDKADAVLAQIKAKDNLCLHDGATKDYDGYAGNVFLSASLAPEKGAPLVTNRRGAPVTAGQEGAPYSGCYVVVSVDVWAQDNDYGKRVNAQLRWVQFYKAGDAFAAGAAPATLDEMEDLGDLGDAGGETVGAGDSLV
jgi:hypothetical protein